MRPKMVLAVMLCLVLGLVPAWAYSDSTCVEGNGESVTEKRALNAWDKLGINGVFEVEIEAGAAQSSFELSGESNIIPHVITEVEDNGTLRIYLERSVCMQKPLQLHIRTDQISRLKVGGSSDVRLNGLKQQMFSLEMQGSDGVSLAGTVEVFHAAMDGTSMLDAMQLQAQDVHIAAHGTSTARVHAGRKLDAKAADLARIVYSGDPHGVEREVSALGSVRTAE